MLEAATNELEKMTLQAAQYVIDNKLYARPAIPEAGAPETESASVLMLSRGACKCIHRPLSV